MMVVMGACLFMAAGPVAALFAPNDPLLSEYCANVLRISALSYPFAGIQIAMNGAFRGAGDTFMAMVLSLVGSWGLQISLAIGLSLFPPLQDMGLWWSILVAAILNALIGFAYFKLNRWKRKVV